MTQKLPRVLRFPDLVLLTLGSVIGSGIFIVPATVLTLTGGAVGPALFVWVAGGVLSLLGALTYAELAAMKPESGGLYVFIRDAFGTLGRIPLWLGDVPGHRQRDGCDAGSRILSLSARAHCPLAVGHEGGRSSHDHRHCHNQRARHPTQREPAEL